MEKRRLCVLIHSVTNRTIIVNSIEISKIKIGWALWLKRMGVTPTALIGDPELGPTSALNSASC